MKYIKLFEKRLIGYIYPIGKSWANGDKAETLEEVYEYLYDLGAEPRVLKHPSNHIFFNNNKNNIPRWIINRSTADPGTKWADTDVMIIDEEKEIQLHLAAKKYNL